MATLTQELYRYSHTVGLYAQIGRGFNNPVDVALGHDGMLYVLNRAGSETELRMPYKRVTRCSLDEEYLGEFSSGGTEDGQLMWPVAIAIDADRNIYISDEALHRISIFDMQGRFLGKWGVKGNGAGTFTGRPASPSIRTSTSSSLTVATAVSSGITTDGRFLGQWGGDAVLGN